MDRSDFRRAAHTLQGSADLSAQLLCCLLRAVGVEARLSFSLQPLGFSAAAEPPPVPLSAVGKTTLYAFSADDEPETEKYGKPTKPPAATLDMDGAARTVPPPRIRRMGQGGAGVNAPIDMGRPPPGLTRIKPSKVERPQHPVFWVEAFNTALQKWVSVDAVATKTVGKPSRIEPAMNDRTSNLTYAVAFEEDGFAKDVTRRYAKAYNAKTRRLRVDSTPGGDKWLKKAMKLFRRHIVLVREPFYIRYCSTHTRNRTETSLRMPNWRRRKLMKACRATFKTLRIIHTTRLNAICGTTKFFIQSRKQVE
jgi:xeroderma pigmentosum group C-complementing protein